jgi:hypothetical protein
MTKARRVLAVTAGLAATGALVGALIGGLTLLGVIAWNGGGIGGIREAAFLFALGGGAGAAVGLVFAPVASWTLLRRVPLGRAILTAAAGTILGAVAGAQFLAFNPIISGVVGFIAGVSYLRLVVVPRLPVQSPAQLLSEDSSLP